MDKKEYRFKSHFWMIVALFSMDNIFDLSPSNQSLAFYHALAWVFICIILATYYYIKYEKQ